ERAASAIATSLLHSELTQEQGPGGLMMELGEARAPVAVAIIKLGANQRRGAASVGLALRGLERAIRRASIERSRRALEPLVNRRARELLTEFDQLSSRVQRMGEAFQIGARDHVFAQELKELEQLSPRAVSRAARRLFDTDRAVVVVIEPGARRHREPEGRGASYAGKSHDDAWNAPVDAGEANSALRVPLPRSMLARAQRLRLRNGLEVVLLPMPGVPLLRAQLVFSGGTADDPPGREGLAFLAAHALDFKAFRAFDAAAYKALARFGDDLEVRVAADSTAFAVEGLSSHLDAVLAGLASLIEDGRYSDDLLDLFRRLRRSHDRGARSRSPGNFDRWFDQHALLRRSLYRAVYGRSHPYARSADAWPPSGTRISRGELEVVRTRRFGARNGVLIITGHFDPALAREHVEHWFSDMRPGRAHTIARPPPAPRSTRLVVQLEGDPAGATSVIEIAYATRQDPRLRGARMVAGRILRERMARVREVLGAAYRVSAAHEDNLGPGMFLVSAAVDAKRTDEALVTMLGELARLRDSAAPDLAEAFVRARREVLYRVLAEESGADSAGARIASLVERGESLNAQTELARQIMELTVEELVAVLAADLAPDQETIGLLGPPERIKAARRAAGL
ncbi:MAG TPA: insulinase family protein, partial [Kofleriaceae bacterium]|nr:insulinase family protein [Kofleriaceae bacterium]